MSRIGQGWDVHRLVAGRPLRLGGVEIPFESGLLGHSDGDVALHALCDALLGAVGAGDIGTHFPDGDPRYSGIDSAELVRQVRRKVAERGFTVANVDITILAERPKLSTHRIAMGNRIASLLGVEASRVNIKAKTCEGLGPIGAGEAIAAQAVALVEAGP